MSEPQARPVASLPPHPVLRHFYESAGERQQVVTAMFDDAAVHYDRVTTLMSLGAGARYRRQSLQRVGVASGSRVLDVACGTGQLSEAAIRVVGSTGSVIGVDPSFEMRRVAESRRGINTLCGTADNLPVEDASFDFVVMGYALRHVADLLTTFSEMRRVLRPGGSVALLEITLPSGRVSRTLFKFYLQRFVPVATLIATRSLRAMQLMSYHWNSIEQCVAPPVILDAMQQAGLRQPQRQISLGIFTEYTATA